MSSLTDDDPTPPRPPALGPIGNPNALALPPVPPPRRWPDVVLQLAQSAIVAGGALALARWGLITGREALAAFVVGHLPAALRLGKALKSSSG